MLKERFPELVVGMVVGGFALTLVELLLMNHTEKTQTIGVVVTVLGMGAVALGLVAPKLRKPLLGLLIVVAGSGLFGIYEHLEEAAEHREKAAREQREPKPGPPPLAPLSVSGLALMGGLGLLAAKR